MNNLTLSKPVKFENVDGSETWFVYIIGEDGLTTGEAGTGNSFEEATKNAQAKIDDISRKEKLQEP